VTDVLVVDIGNTTTRVGRWADGEVRGVATLPTREAGSGPAIAAAVKAAEGHGRLEVALSSVAPEVERAWVEWCEGEGRGVMVVRGDTDTPLVNRYEEPARLGPDRLAAAVGAVRRLGAPVVVVSLGTATVVDAVSARRELLGGAIAAGVETGLWALAERTAALPRAAAEAPREMVGRSTEECLRVGAVLGTAALVEGLAARLREVVGEKARAAVTGGLAGAISPHLRMEHEVFPELTLEGIGAIWEHNRGAG